MVFVIVIDDDEDLRELLAQYLRRSGLAVSTAGDGREAFAVLDRAPLPPTAIILDLDMPVMDGRAFLVEKARRAALAPVPVLVVSGAAGLDEVASRADVAAVHRKPLEPDAIRALLDAVAGTAPSGGSSAGVDDALLSTPPAMALDSLAAVTVIEAPNGAAPPDPTSIPDPDPQ